VPARGTATNRCTRRGRYSQQLRGNAERDRGAKLLESRWGRQRLWYADDSLKDFGQVALPNLLAGALFQVRSEHQSSLHTASTRVQCSGSVRRHHGPDLGKYLNRCGPSRTAQSNTVQGPAMPQTRSCDTAPPAQHYESAEAGPCSPSRPSTRLMRTREQRGSV
jgi:hypothetical protein